MQHTREYLRELSDILLVPGKVDDPAAVEAEIERIMRRCSSGRSPRPARRVPKVDRRSWKNHLRDKARAGCSGWGMRTKRFYKRWSNRQVRRAVSFPHTGAGYRKVFDLAWTLD